jgi:hypothetical protein
MNLDRFDTSEDKRKPAVCENCGTATTGEDDLCEKCDSEKENERREELLRRELFKIQTSQLFLRQLLAALINQNGGRLELDEIYINLIPLQPTILTHEEIGKTIITLKPEPQNPTQSDRGFVQP